MTNTREIVEGIAILACLQVVRLQMRSESGVVVRKLVNVATAAAVILVVLAIVDAL
jgi:hypothetical protein